MTGTHIRRLGLLPAIGGSLGDLQRHGQLGRILDVYIPAYLERFDRVRYFSYEPERIEDYTADPELRRGVELVVPTRVLPRHARALSLALGRNAAALRQCAVVRVLQAPGSLPAALARVPFVCTYGYSYAAFTTVSAPDALKSAAIALKRRAIEAELRFVLRRASATIVTSDAGEREAVSLGARAVVRVPNGVDTARFTPAPAGQEPLYDVCFVGQLVERKGPLRLVRALAALDGPRRVCFVGDGPQRDLAERACRAAGLDAVFTGVVPNDGVASVLTRSRCFVLPSRLEGHPKSLLEAMAAGIPVVAGDIPGVRELAADGGVLLAPPDDVEAIAAQIAHVLNDPGRARTLGRRGRDLVEREFDLHRLLDRELDLLDRVAGS